MPEDPFLYLVPRTMNRAELARAIRQDIADEIEAINMYQSHHDATDDERARRVLAHVIHEEREHLIEFLALVELLDPAQVEATATARAEVEAMLAGLPIPRPAPASPPQADVAAHPATAVGDLFAQGQRA